MIMPYLGIDHAIQMALRDKERLDRMELKAFSKRQVLSLNKEDEIKMADAEHKLKIMRVKTKYDGDILSLEARVKDIRKQIEYLTWRINKLKSKAEKERVMPQKTKHKPAKTTPPPDPDPEIGRTLSDAYHEKIYAKGSSQSRTELESIMSEGDVISRPRVKKKNKHKIRKQM